MAALLRDVIADIETIIAKGNKMTTKAEIIPDIGAIPPAKGYQTYLRNIGPLMCYFYARTMTQATFTLGFAQTKFSTSNVLGPSLLRNRQPFVDESGEKRSFKVPYLVNAGLGLITI